MTDFYSYSLLKSPEWFKDVSKNYHYNKDEIDAARNKFKTQFSPEILANIPDGELERKIFSRKEFDSLAYALESDPDYMRLFVKIPGKAFPDCWQDNKLDIGVAKEVRDVLVKGADLLEERTLDTVDDYISFFDDLVADSSGCWRADVFGILKYFRILYPNQIPYYYTDTGMEKALDFLGEEHEPTDQRDSIELSHKKRMTLIWQLNDFVRRCGISSDMFGNIMTSVLGFSLNSGKKIDASYYRINTTDPDIFYKKWKLNNYVEVNGLNDYGMFSQIHVPKHNFTGNIDTFMPPYVIVMYGNKVLGIGVFRDPASDDRNVRYVSWLRVFNINNEPPTIDVDDESVFSELTNNSTRKYVDTLVNSSEPEPANGSESVSELPLDIVDDTVQLKSNDVKDPERDYNTGYGSEFSRNRIFFGAPGTGKSYGLNIEKDELLKKGGEFERVTFHPDYTYANFVGCYKPVTVHKKVSSDTRKVIDVLTNEELSAQEKYDELYPLFLKLNKLTTLPPLITLYSDGPFSTKTKDNVPTSDDNMPARNHARNLRPYIDLKKNSQSEGGISYEFVPGPFMRMYVKAVKNARAGDPKPYLLIVEEINRADAAAVFGDIFQLLDREPGKGYSQYPIQTSDEVRNYLTKELGGIPDDYAEIRIPDNMFIWATMNSADQGVFPLDTAFKRRWDFEYVGINDNEVGIKGKTVQLSGEIVEWNDLRRAINDYLAEKGINEDKQIGPYFLSSDIVKPETAEIDAVKFTKAFKDKVIMYLYEDAARQIRFEVFKIPNNGKPRYSEICAYFENYGIDIFNEGIVNRVKGKNQN